MHVKIITPTRNNALNIKTLHSILNIYGNIGDNKIDIIYCKDDPWEIRTNILNSIKASDKVLLLPYGIIPDKDVIPKVLFKTQSPGLIVLPVPVDTLDWSNFKNKCSNPEHEPLSQLALMFNVKPYKPVGDDYWTVNKSTSDLFIIDSKQFQRTLRKKNVSMPLNTKDMTEFAQQNNIKVLTYVNIDVTNTFQHKCVGSIINANNVKITRVEKV